MTQTAPARVRLGDVLVERKLLTQAQLTEALAEQDRSGRKLGRVLVDLGLVSESALHTALSDHLKVPYVDLRQFTPDRDGLRMLPETVARRFRAIVLKSAGNAPLVGMADPTDIFAFDEIKRHLRRSFDLALVNETALLDFIDKNYRRTDEIASLAKEVREELSDSDLDLDQLKADDAAPDAAILRLLQSLFQDAVQVNASDIHIEPGDGRLRIRQRVDGELQEQSIEGERVATALVTRLKLMCGLDIAEKRLPQDGRFSMKVTGRSFDVRVSTLPTIHGESLVMRLLDQSAPLTGMDQLGLGDALLKRFSEIAQMSAGMVLVTGPTGSGKTTTLYSVLQHLNQVDTKIITVEDPVEYRLDRIVQVQVQPKIGLDFARVLRTALRQDPDVLLIGEMRDRETAEIGLRAAMTGHMVFSTLHTLNAAAAVSRLIDMGAEPFLVAASLKAVLAQRLVRKLCVQCSADAPLSDTARSWLERRGPSSIPAGQAWRSARGCHQCNHTGFRGRLAVYEFLDLDRDALDAIRRNDLTAFQHRAGQLPGFVPLADAGIEVARRGLTSIEEVMRVLSGLEDRPAETAAEQRLDEDGVAKLLSA